MHSGSAECWSSADATWYSVGENTNFGLAETWRAQPQVSSSYNKSKYPGFKKTDRLPTAPAPHSAITLAHLKRGLSNPAFHFKND